MEVLKKEVYDVSKAQKFYFAGGVTIAVRTVIGETDTLQWILSDHLSSASVTANEDGTWNSTIQYTAFGEIRATSGLTATKYRYTGQLAQDVLGLDYYVARFYDPLLGHFISADTIVPSPSLSAAYNRFAYVLNNPIRMIDPSGHRPSGECEAGEECKPSSASFHKWYTGDDKGYKGSGSWAGHGPRQLESNILGITNYASNLGGLFVNSWFQSKEVHLTGDALDKLKNDPELLRFEKKLVNIAKDQSQYGSESFYFFAKQDITFGGERAPGDMWDQLMDPLNPKYSDTWKVANLNGAGVTVRWAPVDATVMVTKSGSMNITYHVKDTFDLRPVEGRSDAYNAVTTILGSFYHDLLGGNDQMKVYADWTVHK